VVTSIDVIAHEEVVGVGCLASYFEEFHEIMELAMDVSANDDRRPYWLDV
jgi:hypothetical protein